MKRLIALTAAAMLTGCAHSDTWTKRDTAMYGTTVGLLIADARSTSQIQYDPTLVEGGPVARQVLGPQPSTADSWQYMAGLAVIYYGVGRALPANWRPWFYGFTIVDHGSAVVSNCQAGLCE